MSATILIVEDERAIADTLVYALRTEGYQPEWMDLGLSALERLRRGGVDLVILDVGLPDLSGFEVCRRLRTFSELPVIFLTARGEEVDRIVGLELGADDYVTKPFSPREVSARVRGILRRMAKSIPAAGGLDMDPSTRSARFRGTPLDLTRYEFDLLRVLHAQPGRVFTRQELLERVWSAAEETLERTVDTHVKTLRGKLRAVDAEADPILTHRGIGYSLALP